MSHHTKANQRRHLPPSSYDSDLSDAEWEIIQPLLPRPKSGGRVPTVDRRAVLNGIFYTMRSGCAWRLLPHDFPKWQTVYGFFRSWKKDGTWKKIHDKLRDRVRLSVGKKKQPTAGIIDSQSVKTTEKGGFVAMMLVKK